MTMADKIVVMHDGVIEQMGAPLELYDRPANLFVAGFIGSPAMNLIPGRISGQGFQAAGAALPITSAPAAAEGQPAFYGIRPEHFQLSGEGMPVEVMVVEPTGSETQLIARMAGGQAITAVFRERIQASPGETIRIQPDPALVHLFDEASGQRLN